MVTAEQNARHKQETHHVAMHHEHQSHQMDMASNALDMVKTAHAHDASMAERKTKNEPTE
jgi:hypothetical protein